MKYFPVRTALLLCVLFFFLSACSSKGTRILMINTRDVPAAGQYMPGEITAMMEDLGYRFIQDPDPVKAAQRHGDYRMQYRARDADDVRVDVRIQMLGDKTGFYFYQAGRDELDAGAEHRYHELRARVETQFGAANVVEDRPFYTP